MEAPEPAEEGVLPGEDDPDDGELDGVLSGLVDAAPFPFPFPFSFFVLARLSVR